MATIALTPVRHVYNTNGGALEGEKVTFGGSPIAGELMFRTGNTATVCGADPTAISYVSISDNTGIIPGDSSSMILAKIKPTDIFEMNYWHTTAANATLANGDITDILQYGVARQTVSGATAWVVDATDTTNKRVNILRIAPNSTSGDTYVRVWVQFTPVVDLTFQ